MMSRHNMQLYSSETFSHVLATIEFIMSRRQLLSIPDWSFSYSDLSQCTLSSVLNQHVVFGVYFFFHMYFLIFHFIFLTCVLCVVYDIVINK